jgi:hypothetical protein
LPEAWFALPPTLRPYLRHEIPNRLYGAEINQQGEAI